MYTIIVGVIPIERLASIEEGEFSKQAALVFHFGHNSPGPNLKLYNLLVSNLAEKVWERWKVNAKSEYTVFSHTCTHMHTHTHTHTHTHCKHLLCDIR